MRTPIKTLFVALLLAANAAAAFDLSSADIKAGKPIPDRHLYKGFGCAGENVSPALEWRNPPQQTRSFALLVHDPDAPSGGAGWWHWVVYNIPPEVSALPQGAGAADGTRLPKGAVQQRTDFGTPGWGGPCPPVGDRPHRYVFTLHALKVDRLDVPADATASMVGFLVNASSIGKSTLTVRHARK